MAEPLSVGNVGDSLDDMLGSSFTDWTTAGGGPSTLTSRQMRVLTDKLDALDKWQKAHTGLDAWAAGPDYPHPSQKVRVLQFFEGNGLLNNNGFQFIGFSDLETDRGLFWVQEYTEEPYSAYPLTSLHGVVSPLATLPSYAYSTWRAATSIGNYSSLVIDGTSSRSSLDVSALHSGTSVHLLVFNDTSTAPMDRAVMVRGAVLNIEGGPLDLGMNDGSLYYRTDTFKFRARINGATENLATESYVTTAIPTTMNKQPYAAKTTTYVTTATDGVIALDATAGSFTVTLVTAVGNAGLTQTFKKTTAANVVTIDANTTQTIDGALTYALVARWSWLTLVSDGANWLITGAG